MYGGLPHFACTSRFLFHGMCFLYIYLDVLVVWYDREVICERSFFGVQILARSISAIKKKLV